MVGLGKQIGLLHHAGGGNLGDDATLDAVIHNIKRRWPGASICGFTMNPEDTQRRHGIPSYPIRHKTWNLGHANPSPSLTFKDRVKAAVSKSHILYKLLKAINTMAINAPSSIFREVKFLFNSFRVIRSFDLFIVCGGGQLIESSGGPWTFLGGPWNFPYTIFKWILLARLARVKPIVLNVGAGPLVRSLSKGFVRGALSLSGYASFRDEQSRTLARHIGFTGATHVFPDSAYSRDIPAPGASRAGTPGGPIVGFAPMAYGDPRLSPEHDRDSYNCFIRELGLFGSWLIENHHSLTLFCSDIGVDPPSIEDVEEMLRAHHGIARANTDGSLRRVHQWSVEELLENMRSMDYVIACRYHAVIFAHMLNIPVLAISHHPKVKALMNELGLSKYCVDISMCDVNVLADAFKSLVSDREKIKSRMAEKLECYRKQLAAQFDELFPPGLSHRAKSGDSGAGFFVPGLALLFDLGFRADSTASGFIARIAELC